MLEEKEVTASEETVKAEEQEIAEKVAEQVEQQVTEEVTEEVKAQEKPLSPEQIQQMVENATTKSLNSFKGSFANWTASQQKELKNQIDEVLNPLREQAQIIEQSRVQEMSPEEQAEYYKSQLDKTKEVPQQEPPVQQQMSSEQTVLAEMTQDLINESGLGIDIRDSRVWKGYTQGMSTRQALKLAEKNIEEIKNPSQQEQKPVQKEKPAEEAPVPSTTGAPKGGSGRITSQSDLAEMMANGQIDATQFRAARKELKNQGYTNL
tara:strand:- start:2508 stop:3299 length:792 start_codon:yes stop_codon:yes gene_type:complete